MEPFNVFDTGFTVVHQPEDPDIGSPLVDIVLIHGLQGHPYRTWATNSPMNQSRNSSARPESPASASSDKRSIHRSFLGFAAQLKKSNRAVPRVEVPLSEAETAVSVFWPADLLPQMCPRARILVWGYDTRVTRPLGEAVNKSNIFSQGKDLLFAFRRERDLDVPVIFIAHSLGGIILKEALTGSYHSGETDLENIVRSTKAVIFMGTPHRGSKDMAGVGEVARKVASAFMIDTNSAMLDSLGLRNSDIERCQDAFTRIWHKFNFKIKTFQEGLPYMGVNVGMLNEKVVPDFSTLLGDPREHAETLQANHMEMCRFWGERDPNFRKVGGELRSMYSSIIRMYFAPDPQSEWYRHSDSQNGRKALLPDYRDAHLRLYFPELGQRQQTIETALKDTRLRVLESEQYDTWFRRCNLDQHQGLLWIKGKPGSGKSTFMKKAVRHTRTQQTSLDQQVISFFFNARGNELEKTSIGMFRALLYQLLPMLPDRMHDFIQACNQKMRRDNEPVWDHQELKDTLRSLFAEPCQTQIFIFVDALDECVGDGPRDILYFFRELSTDAYSAGAKLNICVSSRHYPTITVNGHYELVLEDYSGSDISLFVDRRLSMVMNRKSSREIRHWFNIRDEIIQKASGIFLWAKLVLDVLLTEYDNGKSMKSLKIRLFSVPQALEDLYTQILQGIDLEERAEAARFFSWVLLATRPIQCHEWYQLLAFISERPPKSLAKWRKSRDAISDADQLQRRIRRISRGLVEIKRPERTIRDEIIDDEHDSIEAAPGSLDLDTETCGTLVFIHESVRQFFLSCCGFQSLFTSIPANALGQAHLSMLKTCFDYLAIKELDALVDGRMNAPPSKVPTSSSSCWVRSIPRDLRQIIPTKSGESLARRKSTRRARSFGSTGSIVGSSASNCHSRERIPAIFTGHLQSGSSISTTSDPKIFYPQKQSRLSRRYILERFLSSCDEYDSSSEGTLDMISIAPSLQSRGKVLKEIPSLLYYTSEMIAPHAIAAEKEGCNPSGLIDYFQDGDHWARWVSLCDDMSRGTSLLYFAVDNGLSSWASYLLETGTNVSTKGGQLIYPFISAAYHGNQEMLELLLQNGANVNAQGRKGWTALHYLAASSDYALIRMILKHYDQQTFSSIIDAYDVYGRTPLHVAASRSDERTVRVLVEHGAEVNYPDFLDNTTLHFASNREDQNLEIIKYLIDSGAIASQSNCDGNSACDLALYRKHYRSFTFLKEYKGPETSAMISPPSAGSDVS